VELILANGILYIEPAATFGQIALAVVLTIWLGLDVAELVRGKR